MNNYVILFAVVVFAPALIIAQRTPIDLLPHPYECGMLREEQFYNLQKTVEPNEFPWLAKLRFENNSRLRCVAVLIHKRYLLTTSTCLSETPPNDAIEMGWCEWGNEDCLTVREFESITHPSFDPKVEDITTRENNIGLLRLMEPIEFTDYIRPICLPSADVSDMDFVAQHLSLTGFLNLGEHTIKTFPLIVGLHKCRNFLGQVNEHFICANTCDNGSKFRIGTALMNPRIKYGRPDHYYLVGLLSIWKLEGCEGVDPDMFLRIDRHLNWIMNNIFERETKK